MITFVHQQELEGSLSSMLDIVNHAVLQRNFHINQWESVYHVLNLKMYPIYV